MAQDHPFTPEQDRALRALVSRRLRPQRTALLLLAAALAGVALAGARAVRARVAGETRAEARGELVARLADLRARGDALAAELAGLRAELEARSGESGRDAVALTKRLDEAEGGLRSLESRLSRGGAPRPGAPRPSAEIAPILERLYNLEARHDALDRARESFERGVLARLHGVEAIRDRAEGERVTREQALLGRLANLEERLYGVETRGATGSAPPASTP